MRCSGLKKYCWSISSSKSATVSGRCRCALLHANCAPAASTAFFKTSSGPRRRAPATGADVLFVAYLASAELGCYRALGWPMPERILDLYVEFRERTNGLPTVGRFGLLGALAHPASTAWARSRKRKFR